MTAPIRVLVAGLGDMGRSHLSAYLRDPAFEVVGLVNRSKVDLPEDARGLPFSDDFDALLRELRPELVSINTYSDTHASLAIRAMEADAHVFVEKPIATTVEDARNVVDAATRLERKLVVGYILRHHPSWQKFIALAQEMGGPYVFRLNLNQQSMGATWAHHKKLLASLSPIVDCGVHYVDVMCQVTRAPVERVQAIGCRLSDEIAPDMYNWGQLQVTFKDGSMGWYEAGWGPMISEQAFFVKDILSPKGCVSIEMSAGAKSADLEAHTKTNRIRLHSAATGEDTLFDMADEPGHQALCDREQAFVGQAIRENLDLTDHMNDAITSLAVVLAADRAVKSGTPQFIES